MLPPRRSLRALALLLLIAAVCGCRTCPDNGITQVATIDALLAGVYGGHLPLSDLRRYGDLGIGTFDRLDGEMVLLDGCFYQVRGDGRIAVPALSERTPFACVTRFEPDRREDLGIAMDLQALQARIDAAVPQPNRFCALKLRGTFQRMRVRSVPAQQPPYRPLAEVTKSQPEFAFEDVRGVLVGFRSPAFVKGVNVPGYHWHFLSDDRTGGGHVLACTLSRGTLEADTRHEWLRVLLPTASADFDNANLLKDRSQELRAAER
ncbi:MAG: acetolactate decarboxylase [Kiritimatiellae bacterium]|nr:acetolactate decarboxylase [Kiritimatiellia bacterium]